MARTIRSRAIDAPPERVWEVLADPHHLPRWWPGVIRVEGVTADRFTQVSGTRRGRVVRLDQRVTVSDSPRHRAWEQELQGTPFERLISAWRTTVTIERQPTGSLITILEEQELKGSFRLGLPLQRRPAKQRLDAALAGLAALLEP